jgi:hypothetical protein
MADVHAVALDVIASRGAADRALQDLAKALGGAHIEGPDDAGIVTVHVEAESREAALQMVWDAIAAAGADDELAFAEHPDIPRHWQRRTPADLEGLRRRVRKFLQQVKGTPQPDVDIDGIAEAVGITHGEAELIADELVEAGELIRDGDTYLVAVEPAGGGEAGA